MCKYLVVWTGEGMVHFEMFENAFTCISDSFIIKTGKKIQLDPVKKYYTYSHEFNSTARWKLGYC